MRSIWSGSLNFGLINIPVNLYSASEEQGLNLDMLHEKDHGRIRYARVCKADGQEVPYDEIVKGYEVQEGEYVVLTPQDFKKANVEKTGMIEIVQFCDVGEIDPIYYEKPYALEPKKGADKPYALLREALEKSSRVGIARFVLRNREHLAMVMPHDDALLLMQLRFASEIRPLDDLRFPGKASSKKELEMAQSLIDHLTERFEPKQFHDTYIEELEKLIQAKAKGKAVVAKGSEPKPTPVGDIMDLLRKSLAEDRTDHRTPERRPRSAVATKSRHSPARV